MERCWQRSAAGWSIWERPRSQGERFTNSVNSEWREAFEGGTYVYDDMVEDGNIIAAWPNAYADFALTLGRRMGAFKDADEEASTVLIVREFRHG